MLSHRPLFWAAVALTVGVSLADRADGAVPAICALVVLAAAGALWIRSRSLRFGVLCLAVAAAAGSLRFASAIRAPAGDISRLAPARVQIAGRVVSESPALSDQPHGPGGATAVAVEAMSASAGGQARPVRGVVRALLSGGSPGARLPQYGDSVRLSGLLGLPRGPRNPGGYDERAALRKQGIFCVIACHPHGWSIAPHAAPGRAALLPLLADRLRAAILRQLTLHLPPLHAAVAAGMLFGARDAMPETVREDFQRTGAAHILATAGLHVGLLAALLLGALRWVWVPRRAAHALTIAGILLYSQMAGGRPSVTRAAIAAAIYLGATVVEREPDALNSLGAAAVALLLLHPLDLFDAGFQLSFATVLTIVALLPYAEERLRRVRGSIAAPAWQRRGRAVMHLLAACLVLAVAAQLGSWPLTAYYFNDLSLVSIPANALAVPAVGIALGLMLVGALTASILPPLAAPLFLALNGVLAYLIRVLRLFSAVPHADIAIASPPPALILAYYALLWWAAWRFRPVPRAEGEEAH